jgi:Asp-tRNA(Asn)/Glu-tRNA(Gln) amidotransferase A subunit family amidase
MPLTAGSVLFAKWYPGKDAFLVKHLRDAGAIILATGNMHEFAMGVDTLASLHGQTRNPYALDHIPGGSSGGSAAAVAAGFAAFGMGTDTCGSIRIPAAFNSLVGLRATQGMASRSGIFPLAPSQDIGGPLTRSVTDAVIVLDVIAGYDPADPQTSLSVGHVDATYQSSLRLEGLQQARIGVLTSLLRAEPEDEEVAGLIDQAVKDMTEQGARMIPIDMPGLEEITGGYLSRKEFRFALKDYLATHSDPPVESIEGIIDSGQFHPDMEPRLEAAQYAVSLEDKDYVLQLSRRHQLRELILNTMAMHKLDGIVYPTMRRKAALIGERQMGNNCYLSARSGLPSITVPAGFSIDGLPVGVEFLARPWEEARLLSMAYAYEQATKHRRSPPSTPPL